MRCLRTDAPPETRPIANSLIVQRANAYVFCPFVVVPALAAVLTLLGHGSSQSHIMHVAIGTSLATILFTSLRSVQAHAKRGAVDWNILKGWLPSVIAGVIIGVILTSLMDGKALKTVDVKAVEK